MGHSYQLEGDLAPHQCILLHPVAAHPLLPPMLVNLVLFQGVLPPLVGVAQLEGGRRGEGVYH